MSHDFIAPLKRLTPDAASLDRDTLMFEAGRASVPSAVRVWLLVGLLTLSQALTVGLLLFPTRVSTPTHLAPSSGYPVSADTLSETQQGRSEPNLPAHEMTPDEPPLRLVDRHQFISLP